SREQDFGSRLRIFQLVALPELDPDGALALEAQHFGMGIGENAEVGSRHRRAQKRLGGGPAAAIADGALEITDALVLTGVVVIGFRDAELDRRALPSLDDFPALAIFLHPKLAVCPMGVAGTMRVFLDALEIGKHVVPRPTDVAELTPDVIVAGVAADVAHGIDRR